MNPLVVPGTSSHAPPDLLSVGFGLRGQLALVARAVAVRASRHDIRGSVAAAFAPRHQVLGGALQTRGLANRKSYCAEFHRRAQPYADAAVEASAALGLIGAFT